MIMTMTTKRIKIVSTKIKINMKRNMNLGHDLDHEEDHHEKEHKENHYHEEEWEFCKGKTTMP
jgi:hypothetical protein